MNLVLVGVDALPSLSPHAIELLDLHIEDDDAESRLLHVVSGEPQLAAKLIGAANSAAFGLSRVRFGTVPLAIRRLGLRRAAQLCTAALVGQPLEVGVSPVRRKLLWLHALTTAVVAADLARRLGIDPAQAYLAGLLHDIGYMFAELREPGVLARLEALAADPGASLEPLEESVLGASHGELTGALLAYWGLPEGLSDLHRHHHRQPPSPPSLSVALSIAEHIAAMPEIAAAPGSEHGALFAKLAPPADEVAGLLDARYSIDPEEFERILARVRSQVAEISGLAAAMSASPQRT
ncbi:MAG: HDOD domain-containing protein [Rhodocyclaceae bacterium]|nr:HDOD domain-containing protein [Rhodocyclaceae bacterium]